MGKFERKWASLMSDKLKEALNRCLRRVSVGANLARRFNAGIGWLPVLVALATIEFN